MKKTALYTMMLGLGSLTLTSCGDAMEELTSVVLDRNFAPIDLEVKSVTNVGAKLDWKVSHEDVTYTVEVYMDDSLDFSSSRVLKFEGITNGEVPYQVTGLEYDTKCSARVMTIDNKDASRNSKWSTVYFRTSAQQLFDTPTESDIADRSVTMTWKAGEVATVIKAFMVDADNNESLAVEQNISAQEIEAGVVTVKGLQPETKYVVRLYNGEKKRGEKTITTIADLNGATLVHEGDDFRAMIEAAEEGQVFALYGGTHFIADEDEAGKSGAAKVAKSIVIKGIYPTNIPVVKGRFEILDGASLELNQVILDGADNATTDQAFNFKTAGVTYQLLSMQNSELRNFGKGVFYLNVASTVGKLEFRNTLIHGIQCDGGDMFDSRKGRIDELNIISCTLYNSCASRDFIRMDDASSLGGTPTITVDGCTIDGCANASGKRLLYVRYVGNVINWSNNLVTNTAGVWSNQSKTAVPEFKNNAYFNCVKLNVLDGADGGKTNLFIDEGGKEVDNPNYKDAANGDFTIGNEDVKKLGVGDPRWR